MTPTDLDSPGKRIKFLRKSKGWTQETFARKVFVTQPAVAQWEADLWLPARPTQVLIADELGTTRLFLFGENTTEAAVSA